MCRRRPLLTTNHNDNSASTRDHQRLGPVTPDHNTTPAPTTGIGRIGRIFQRRLNATAQLSCDPLTSIGHLRTGQYYRWNPDISHIPASQSSRTALCKSPTDVNVLADSDLADSAASSPWQHKAFLCSDSDTSTTSHDIMSPRLQQPVSIHRLLTKCFNFSVNVSLLQKLNNH